MSHLRIGLPSKGRLADQAAELLGLAGLSFRRQNRGLFARVGGLPVDITFLRTDDIPLLCAEGAIDLGITGSDLVEEAGVSLTTRLALDVGRCRLSVCVPDDGNFNSPGDLDGQRVATSFPRITQRYFAEHQAKVHLVPLSGSVEIMISLGVADAIVDLVQTGSTLAANRLRVMTNIASYETVLVQNQPARMPDVADLIVRRLEGVVIARGWSLLEYNVPKDKLAEAERIAPGFNSPTINALEDNQWCAVQVMVERKNVIAVMDQLEQLGATAILETRIANCRL
ncbi:MAG: ATP phosphoribosyltransferase [Pirellulaceae bacterium]|jgi:ATP phosphoribosyltransferase|nr:ATP phosphoribosyltransferase [Pirellulaceae bacterium]MDP6721875.1 ATP phosphoribosyltransferase [Pirellulaceae bacterium]